MRRKKSDAKPHFIDEKFENQRKRRNDNSGNHLRAWIPAWVITNIKFKLHHSSVV